MNILSNSYQDWKTLSKFDWRKECAIGSHLRGQRTLTQNGCLQHHLLSRVTNFVKQMTEHNPYKSHNWKPRGIFGMPAGMKSREWKLVACDGILKFCICGFLGKSQRETLFMLCDVLARICAETFEKSFVEAITCDVHCVLTRLERDFSVSLHVIVFYLLHHLPAYLKIFVLVYGFWMFPYERFNSWIKQESSIKSQVSRSHSCRNLPLVRMDTFPSHQRQYARRSSHHTCQQWKRSWTTGTRFSYACISTHTNHPTSGKPSEEAKRILTIQFQTRHMEIFALVTVRNVRQHPWSTDWESFHPRMRGYYRMGQHWLENEGSLCSDLDRTATLIKRHRTKDRYGRTSTIASENCDSKRCSSIYSSQLQRITFRRNKFMFEHSFAGSSEKFAWVTFFEGHCKDSKIHLFM